MPADDLPRRHAPVMLLQNADDLLIRVLPLRLRNRVLQASRLVGTLRFYPGLFPGETSGKAGSATGTAVDPSVRGCK
jgi:hypothetical protein